MEPAAQQLPRRDLGASSGVVLRPAHLRGGTTPGHCRGPAVAFAAGCASARQLRTRRPKPRAARRASSEGSWQAPGPARSRPLRVIIAGGGPGGLALACGLADIPGLEIRILEGRPEVKTGTVRAARSHTIGLGRRAREALIQLGGQELWDQISQAGLMADGFTLHLNGVPLSLPPPEGEPVVLVARTAIVAAVRDRLFAREFAAGTDVKIEFSSRVGSVDVVHRTVTVIRDFGTPQCKEEVLDYDLLIGCDGVRSRVREAMNSQLPPGRFESELRVMPGRWQVLHLELPQQFSPTAVHAMVSSDAPFGLFCIPDAAGPHCVIISWSSDDAPQELLDAKTPEAFEEVMLRYFPQLERIPAAAAEGFTKSAASKAVVSRCRPLHDADHAICVLGDAAHAVGGGSLGQGCSAALQDAAALASCLREGAQLNQALPDVAQVEDDDMQEWVQGREEALVSSIAAFSEQRAAEGWALLDLIELQSAAEVRASALVQGPLVFGFFLEQLGRGTLKPLADIGARLLEERLQSNRQSSAKEVDQFVTHLKFKPTMGFSPAVIFFLAEKAILGLWKAVLDLLGRLQPPMQTALMATDESYSALVGRNQTWLALLRSARAAAGVTRISSVRKIDAFKDMDEDTCALWAANFTSQERLQEDVLVRQSAPPDQQSFFCILKGSCQVLREGAVVAELQVGHCFGEAALMLKVPSPVSIKATSDATLLVMKGQVFQDLLPKSNQKLRAALAKAAERYGAGFEQVVAEQEAGRKSVRRLLQDVVGSPWSWSGPKHSEEPLDLDKLLGTVGVESYVKGDVIALGCQRLRVLEQGTCNVIRGGRLVRSLKEGHFFGPDLAADERVVACDEKVRVCSFTNEATTSLGLLLNQTEVQDWQEAFS